MKELNNDNFSEGTTEASKDGLVVVDFWAPWCGPCKAFMPVLEELESELTEITIAKVNIEDNPAIPPLCGIRAVPTIQIYKDGKVAAQASGILTKEQVLELIDSCGT